MSDCNNNSNRRVTLETLETELLNVSSRNTINGEKGENINI
jgi:hypothetical protein